MKKKRVSTASSALNSLTGDKDHFSTPGIRGYFHTGDFIPDFGGKAGETRVFLHQLFLKLL